MINIFYSEKSQIKNNDCPSKKHLNMAYMNWTKSIKLNCTIQNYAWGAFGEDAYINKLMQHPTDATPKAELWMGAHPKAPSKIKEISLFDLIQTDAINILGEPSIQKWGKMLPYLFKVLSANDALSIQLHPNKSEAEELHSNDPDHYPDDNHKPEIAIALDQLEALVGFEPYDDLVQNLETYPEIIIFIGTEFFELLKTACSEEEKLLALKKAFMQLNLNALKNKLQLKELNQKLFDRLTTKNNLSPKERWYLKLHPTYSEGDVGLFALFFLNYQVLKKGQAVFLKADVPHAYLKGNIIECMANSDNVVRAGLTPKFVDVENLAKITQYELKPLPILSGIDNGLGGLFYQTPVEEFEVHFFNSQIEISRIDISSWSGACIGIVLEGQISFDGEENNYLKGEVFLVPDRSNLNATLQAHSEVCFAKPNLT